ncbi:MAG: UvrB/UvrC motif-containing protein [Candidatus Krumholzibacteria bacterium]|nr:UvrB/UvrC motif-containing protein [Candidatus Krumholzibacteria bacterium]
MPVMCKQCGIRPSKIHYTEIVNNQMVTTDLCLECAEAKGIDVHTTGSYSLGDLVAGLIDTSAQTQSEKMGKVQCPKCGFDYSNFKKSGRLGCSECYTAFETQLLPLLRQLHGSTRHQGKSPRQLGPIAIIRKEIMDLKDTLTRAIEEENYEEAARIRDRIKTLETRVEET